MKSLSGIIWFLVIGALFYWMMKKGGCCGGGSHDHQSGSDVGLEHRHGKDSK